MQKDFYNDWQKHLENIDEHYDPDVFFEKSNRPDNGSLNIKDNFNSPDFFDEEVEEEGQLSVDIYQDEMNLYVVAPIAGINPKEIEIIIEKDILTIRGERKRQIEVEERNAIFRECHWGSFSRSVILPTAVQEDKVEAKYNEGVLTIILPKQDESKAVKVNVQ
jgi:HSP20 family protein